MQGKNYESKLKFAEAFVELVEAGTGDKITVNMLAESIGKHRKTFYYHFTDKEHLIAWLFRYDLALMLQELFPAHVLVWEKQTHDSAFPEFPYYIRNITDTYSIYNAPFFETIADVFEKRRVYYKQVFAESGKEALQNYIYNLYCPALQDDITYLIEKCLENKNDLEASTIKERLAQKSSVDFLAEYYTGAFIYRLIRRLNYASSRRTLEEIMPFENITHDTLYLLLCQHSSQD